MSKELLASKVIIVEEEARVPQIQGVPTNVLGMVGITERGPVGERVRSTSFNEWFDVFGGAIANGDAYHSVQGFYLNGGQVLDFVRTVHYTDINTPASKTSAAGEETIQTAAGAPTQGTVLGTVVGPFDLAPGDTLLVSVDGAGPLTATFNATQASVTGASTQPFALVDGQALTFRVDSGAIRTAIFNTAEFVNIAAATAAEVAAVINAECTGVEVTAVAGAVVIKSDTYGTDSDLDTFGGTACAALGFTGLSATGTGNVADINAVAVAEVKTIVEAAVVGVTVTNDGGAARITRNTAGASFSVAVTAASTADDELGLDNATHSGTSGAAQDTLTVTGKYDGTYTDDLSVVIAAATSGVVSEFNLKLLDAGVVVEVWPNLTMDTAGERYVETLLNNVNTGSLLLAVTDESAGGTPTERRPANGTYSSLVGGNDGLVGLVDNDFIGSSAGPTGLRVLDQSLDLALLAIPDQPTSAVHNAMVTYCEDTRDGQAFAIIDPPAGLDRDEIVDYVEVTAGLLNLTEYAAIYWPQIKVVNPSVPVFGDVDSIVVPPSGHIAGVFARTDGSRPGGIYQPPAGVERGVLRGVVGFETDTVKQEAVRDIVYPKRINPLTTGPGLPLFIDGTKTLRGDSNFPSVAERRGVIYIQQSLKGGLQFARHSNNTAELRRRVDRAITAFLLIQFKQGAFRGATPATSFFVDVGDGINPPSEQFARKLHARIGLATNKPVDFVILRFSQDTRELETELQAAGA
jgi:hypothetical protein